MGFKKDINKIANECRENIIGLKISDDLKGKLNYRLETMVQQILDQEVKILFFFTNKRATAYNLKTYFTRREVLNNYLFDHTKSGAKIKPYLDLYEERLLRYCRRFYR